ncbi:ankyrin repeat domain-containing protein 24 [Clonorchis sinensis]|uniref:Ankyrin repeat domain-containing protein 24 n=1 Tax=Clonorchis sinensis TaxID=79923 RepID=H2KNU5_CLOSI|nr:ankyrin repeat domain-containing protein 24 [Clonorchis sinensis]
MKAIEAKSYACVELLIAYRADLLVTDANGDNALHQAAQSGHIQITRRLLMAGISVDVQNSSGKTALHLAVNNRDTAMVTFLLECNASVNCLDCDGRSPIMLACIVGHLPAVELLLRAGAELDIRDKDGWNAIDLAQVHRHDECRTAVIQSTQQYRRFSRFSPNGWNGARVPQNDSTGPIENRLRSGRSSDTPSGGMTPISPPSRTPIDRNYVPKIVIQNTDNGNNNTFDMFISDSEDSDNSARNQGFLGEVAESEQEGLELITDSVNNSSIRLPSTSNQRKEAFARQTTVLPPCTLLELVKSSNMKAQVHKSELVTNLKSDSRRKIISPSEIPSVSRPDQEDIESKLHEFPCVDQGDKTDVRPCSPIGSETNSLHSKEKEQPEPSIRKLPSSCPQETPPPGLMNSLPQGQRQSPDGGNVSTPSSLQKVALDSEAKMRNGLDQRSNQAEVIRPSSRTPEVSYRRSPVLAPPPASENFEDNSWNTDTNSEDRRQLADVEALIGQKIREHAGISFLSRSTAKASTPSSPVTAPFQEELSALKLNNGGWDSEENLEQVPSKPPRLNDVESNYDHAMDDVNHRLYMLAKPAGQLGCQHKKSTPQSEWDSATNSAANHSTNNPANQETKYACGILKKAVEWDSSLDDTTSVDSNAEDLVDCLDMQVNTVEKMTNCANSPLVDSRVLKNGETVGVIQNNTKAADRSEPRILDGITSPHYSQTQLQTTSTPVKGHVVVSIRSGASDVDESEPANLSPIVEVAEEDVGVFSWVQRPSERPRPPPVGLADKTNANMKPEGRGQQGHESVLLASNHTSPRYVNIPELVTDSAPQSLHRNASNQPPESTHGNNLLQTTEEMDVDSIPELPCDDTRYIDAHKGENMASPTNNFSTFYGITTLSDQPKQTEAQSRRALPRITICQQRIWRENTCMHEDSDHSLSQNEPNRNSADANEIGNGDEILNDDTSMEDPHLTMNDYTLGDVEKSSTNNQPTDIGQDGDGFVSKIEEFHSNSLQLPECAPRNRRLPKSVHYDVLPDSNIKNTESTTLGSFAGSQRPNHLIGRASPTNEDTTLTELDDKSVRSGTSSEVNASMNDVDWHQSPRSKKSTNDGIKGWDQQISQKNPEGESMEKEGRVENTAFCIPQVTENATANTTLNVPKELLCEKLIQALNALKKEHSSHEELQQALDEAEARIRLLTLEQANLTVNSERKTPVSSEREDVASLNRQLLEFRFRLAEEADGREHAEQALQQNKGWLEEKEERMMELEKQKHLAESDVRRLIAELNEVNEEKTKLEMSTDELLKMVADSKQVAHHLDQLKIELSEIRKRLETEGSLWHKGMCELQDKVAHIRQSDTVCRHCDVNKIDQCQQATEEHTLRFTENAVDCRHLILKSESATQFPDKMNNATDVPLVRATEKDDTWVSIDQAKFTSAGQLNSHTIEENLMGTIDEGQLVTLNPLENKESKRGVTSCEPTTYAAQNECPLMLGPDTLKSMTENSKKEDKQQLLTGTTEATLSHLLALVTSTEARVAELRSNFESAKCSHNSEVKQLREKLSLSESHVAELRAMMKSLDQIQTQEKALEERKVERKSVHVQYEGENGVQPGPHCLNLPATHDIPALVSEIRRAAISNRELSALQQRVAELQADRDWLAGENERLIAKLEKKGRVSQNSSQTFACSNWPAVPPPYPATSVLSSYPVVAPFSLAGPTYPVQCSAVHHCNQHTSVLPTCVIHGQHPAETKAPGGKPSELQPETTDGSSYPTNQANNRHPTNVHNSNWSLDQEEPVVERTVPKGRFQAGYENLTRNQKGNDETCGGILKQLLPEVDRSIARHLELGEVTRLNDAGRGGAFPDDGLSQTLQRRTASMLLCDAEKKLKMLKKRCGSNFRPNIDSSDYLDFLKMKYFV